jgi:hypothetical protein
MFITDQSSKYTNITAPALYIHNDSLPPHTHTKTQGAEYNYSTGTFNGTVSYNLLSIYLQLVKILYIRLEYEGQSYITCLSVWWSCIILTECYVFIVVYLTTFTAAQTTCHQMVCWIMKCRQCRKKWFCPKELSRHLPGWTENHHKVLSWYIQALTWIPTWDFQNTKHEWWPPNCNA